MGMKKTEVGMIPEEWNVQIFSDTFRILNNNTFSRAELNYESGQFRNIHYGDVLIRFPEVLDCTRLDVPYINDDCRISGSAQALQDGDVVIADTAEDETVGKVTEVRNTVKKPVMAGLHTIPCRVKSGEFAPMWLGYYMNSHLYHDQLLPYIHGIKVSSVSKGSLAETVIIKPPIEEQKKIVAALSDMDALIKDTEKLIRKYQAVKQACLQRMFPQNGQNEPEMRLPGFTGAWEQRKLETVATFSKGSGYSKGDLQEDGTPIILYGRLYTKYETCISEVDTFVCEKRGSVYSNGGEVIVPASGETPEDIARASTVENKGILLGGDLNVISPNGSIDSAFLALSISNGVAHKELASKAQGKSVVHIHNAEIQALNIAFPSKPEQSQISSYFMRLDHLITLHQRKLKKYKDIKQGMMEELLTGKVRLS